MMEGLMAKKEAAAKTAKATTTVEEAPSLIDQIVEQGRLARDPEAKGRGTNLVTEFVKQLLDGQTPVSESTSIGSCGAVFISLLLRESCFVRKRLTRPKRLSVRAPSSRP
jgi:hypothetical protein